MNLAIVGGRNFDDYDLLMLWAMGVFYMSDCPDIARTVISGGAKGADSLGEQFAKERDIEIIRYLPNWKLYGKSAGFHRNQQIVDACDMVLAFWDGKSRGTADTITKARIAKKPTLIVFY